MVKIRIGCKNSIASTKERNLDLILIRGGTTTSTYKAFDVSVPDTGKPGETITTTCPHCSRRVKINIGIEYSNIKIKNILKMGLLLAGVFLIPFSFVALIMEEIRMIGLMMAFILPLVFLIISITLFHIKKKSKNGVYYGPPTLIDENHFINPNQFG